MREPALARTRAWSDKDRASEKLGTVSAAHARPPHTTRGKSPPSLPHTTSLPARQCRPPVLSLPAYRTFGRTLDLSC